MRKVTLLVAVDDEFGVGKNGKLPWSAATDMRWFRKVTSFPYEENSQNTVVMGWATWESLGRKPLVGRKNVVLTHRSVPDTEGVSFSSSLEDTLVGCTGRVFIIGGASVYLYATRENLVDEALVSRIPGTHGCDRFFDISKFTGMSRVELWGSPDVLVVERYSRRKKTPRDEIVYRVFQSI
jgi:dihydrofolate reductase